MAGRFLQDFSAALTVNGTNKGAITIAAYDAALGPFPGAIVNLLSSGAGPAEYQVVTANPATGVITLRLSSVNGFGTSDVSAFTVAQTATLYQPAQLDANDRDNVVSVSATVAGTTTSNQGTGGSSSWLVAGGKTHNAAVPGATNVGALTAIANTSAPTFTETYQTALSVDLTGNLRTTSGAILLKLNGSPGYLGTIVATASVNNHTTAAPFNNTSTALAGKYLVLQSDTSCYIAAGNSNAVAVTAANGIQLEAGEKFTMYLATNGWVAVLPVTGTSNVKIFELS
jgi:hypothetical protein